MIRFVTIGLLSIGLVACAPTRAPLFDRLGDGHMSVTTTSERAQQYFDQGLILTYGFNHDEAIRSYEEAVRLDPACAMGWWGIAFALGPNINLPLTDPAVARRAYAAAQRAAALSEHATPVERSLIQALAVRYADPPPEDRGALDQAYANAMRDVWRHYPQDPDVGSLFADAMLNLRPWDQWTRDGEPQPGTEEIVATLERVLSEHRDHPLANHLYIHTVEGSSTPERALPAADRLGTLVPAAGHLVHMPAHIYIRVGMYAKAIDANVRAIDADRAYSARVGPQGIYEVYRAHNYHFLAYAAMFAGDQAAGLRAGRDIWADLPRSSLQSIPEIMEGFYAVIWHVMIRFGPWEDILREPAPKTPLTIANAFWHYARGVAFANTGRTDKALEEATAFEEAAASIKDTMRVGATPAPLVVDVARHMLQGEILFRQGAKDEAFAALRKGVELEAALPYDEPRGWMQPVRHALGALLLEVGRIDEAEAVYRADLKINPENGWSLHGLAECLRRQGETRTAQSVEARFEKAWKRADAKIQASCFCRVPVSSVP